MAASSDTKPDIILNSPVGAKPAVYKWPLTYVSKGQKIDGAEEIVETINWVAREYLEYRPAIENLMRNPPDLRSYDCIKSLCDKYNKISGTVLKMNEGTSVAPKTSSRASQGLLKHIIQQVYNYAVTDPNELNKYSPFSSKTYGETNFNFMAQLIEKNQFRPREGDIFIDMGSGVGHLVLQMAASVECKKCYGIEISDNPAKYAKVMEERFIFWMNWHGKTYTEFELFHGDFFEKKYADIIKSANFILVNNFAFKPEVDHKLKQRFLDLRDGVQILSSKPFCSPKSRVTERHLTDIGSIMKVMEIHPEQRKDTVSWTPKPLPYYLHILDASPVEKYYERKKRQQARTNEKGKPTKRRRVGRGSSSDEDGDEKFVCGPTTRKAWLEYCNSTNANQKTTESAKSVTSRNNSTDTEHYESAIENEENTATAKSKENEISHKRERKNDTQNNNNEKQTSQGSSAQTRGSAAAAEKTEAKSCLDKKRDYAIKKANSNNLLQNAPPSTLYSISKPADTTNGTSTSKIPNIVIKVKPPAESKSEDDSSTEANTNASAKDNVKASSEAKTNENNKKLRQRKKSNTENREQISKQKSPPIRAQRETTRKAQMAKNALKSAQKTSPNTSPVLGTTTNNSTTTRAKKATSNTAKPAAPKSQTAPKKKASTSDRGSSLDLLHNRTVESVVGSAGYFPLPAPGCEDHNLKNITETPSLPKVVIKDLSMFINDFLGPKMIERFMEIERCEVDTFARKLQQPGVKEALTREIEKERLRQRMLLRESDEISRDIRSLIDRVPRAMKVHCDDLGIKNSPKALVSHLGALLKKHQDLTAYQLQLEAALHTNHQRTMNPPAAHSNSTQCLSSPYRNASSSATLDLSLKPVA